MKPTFSIPYDKNYPGGPGTFIENFSKELIKKGVQVSDKWYKGDIVLVIVYYSFFKLIILKLILKRKIILRLDGVSEYSKLKKLKSKLIFITSFLTYKYLADGIIHQSEFSKNSAIKAFGKNTKKNQLIYNGVYTKKIDFNPNKQNKIIKIVYWSRILTVKNFLDAKKILNEINIKSNNYEFTIIGTLDNGSRLDEILVDNQIKYLGKLNRNEIYNIGDQFDIFLMFKGSACPNSLLEANSLGLPIVSPDLEGNKELIINNSGIVFTTNNAEPDAIEFCEPILKIVQNLEFYKKNAYNNYIENFTSSRMTENYLKFIINDILMIKNDVS